MTPIILCLFRGKGCYTSILSPFWSILLLLAYFHIHMLYKQNQQKETNQLDTWDHCFKVTKTLISNRLPLIIRTRFRGQEFILQEAKAKQNKIIIRLKGTCSKVLFILFLFMDILITYGNSWASGQIRAAFVTYVTA